MTVARQDTNLTRGAQLRRRFLRKPETESWLASPRRIVRFLILAVRKASADELTQQSAALAFITIVSLIPLLSAFSIVGARVFDQQDNQQRLLNLLSQVLPYSEETLLKTLRTFLENAHTVSGFGFVVFVITAVMAFSSIEKTINQIWNVPHQRPFRGRLVSFTQLLFWGPLVIGTTFSGLFFLRRFEPFERFTRSLPAQFIPFLVTLIGLTMLYWLVPYTKVRFQAAFGGSLGATLLLEAVRQGFGFYIEKAQSVWIVYSGLGLVFFFFVSVQLSWWIILLGTEVSYIIQHHAAMLSVRREAAAPEGSWLGLVALVALAERLRAGEPITPHELLADRLRLPSSELSGVVNPLMKGGLVRETGGDEEGFLLACDPYELRLTEVFDLYERGHWEVLEPLPEGASPELEKLRVQLTDARDQRVGQSVLADLLKREEASNDSAGAEGGKGQSG